MRKVLFLIPLLIVFFTTRSFAQYVFSGTVYDKSQGSALPYAIISSPCLDQPVSADMYGNFEIHVSSRKCEFYFEAPLYANDTLQISFTDKNPKVMKRVNLSYEIVVLDGLDIVEERIDNDPTTATTTVVTVDVKNLDEKGIVNSNEALDKVPGVAVVDNEPQIRGGSGFSSGMGSRVLILLDGMPFLRPDAGRPMWSFIPMEDVKRIDVHKGAASVVFGSSALTGAVNVITAYPGPEPATKISLFTGVYDSPKSDYKKSWGKVSPMLWGASFLHTRMIKRNFDLVLGGEYYSDQSYIGPEFKIADGLSNEGPFETRARFNFGTRYRSSKFRGFFASLNGNFMYSENATSFFWYDCDTNMYRTYAGSLTTSQDFMFYLDPVLCYSASDGSVYKLQNRILYSNNDANEGVQSARSLMVYDEFKYTKLFKRIGLVLEAGLLNNYSTSYGRVFSGSNYDTLPQRMSCDNLAIYAQLEKKFLSNKNLSLVGGARWEVYLANGKFNQKPIFRLGINYQLLASHTAFRASIGQGYRYPSIGERYISINVGRYGFYPNPDLVPESSWNAEFGIVQPYRVGPFEGLFDVAAYYQHFDNFIEFAFGSWGTKGNIMDDMGFMYLNTGPASISGVDVSLVGKGNISKSVEFEFMVSYTYSHPVTKNRNGVYYTQQVNDSVANEYTFVTTASDTNTSILKYRIQHNFKLDMAFTFWKKLSLNVGMAFYSAMRNVDAMFFDYDCENPQHSAAVNDFVASWGDLPFRGYYNYFQENNIKKKGSFVLDVGVTYHILKNLKVSFVVKNILNNEYTLRPMHVEAPRSYNVQLVYGL